MIFKDIYSTNVYKFSKKLIFVKERRMNKKGIIRIFSNTKLAIFDPHPLKDVTNFVCESEKFNLDRNKTQIPPTLLPRF